MKIEKNADAQLGRSFEFSLPKEWSRQEQIDYTTEYIQKTFVDKGMCADWSIHDKGDGNPHVHLLVTMRSFNPDHSWGNKEVKDWDFVRDSSLEERLEENKRIIAEREREKLAGRYKAKTAMYDALMFLLIWYSASTALFQMIRSKVFISDCGRFFDTIATFIQSIAGWIVLTGKNVAQISNGISNPVVAGIIYWLIRLLICGGCLVGAEILLAFIGIKSAELYKKYCWDMITILGTLIKLYLSMYNKY